MELNRVIEIDADSFREGTGEPFLSIRWAKSVDRKRQRQPDANPDLKQDISILTHALALLILEGESQNIFHKGEAISFAIHNLQVIYVDANISTDTSIVDEERRTNNTGRRLDGL